MMMDYITASPIKLGWRDTLRLDDIIIFEFTIAHSIDTFTETIIEEDSETGIACIIFIDYLLIEIQCE
jgi:hypothetical protein